MSDIILQYVIPNLITFFATGGIGSIFYIRQQRRMKEAEVKAAEVEVKSVEIANLAASNEEWIKLYNNCLEEKNRLEENLNSVSERLDDAYRSKDQAWEKYSDSRAESCKKDLVISELSWYRCEINGCQYRKPPRRYGDMEFPKDGVNPVENPDPDVL